MPLANAKQRVYKFINYISKINYIAASFPLLNIYFIDFCAKKLSTCIQRSLIQVQQFSVIVHGFHICRYFIKWAYKSNWPNNSNISLYSSGCKPHQKTCSIWFSNPLISLRKCCYRCHGCRSNKQDYPFPVTLVSIAAHFHRVVTEFVSNFLPTLEPQACRHVYAFSLFLFWLFSHRTVWQDSPLAVLRFMLSFNKRKLLNFLFMEIMTICIFWYFIWS